MSDVVVRAVFVFDGRDLSVQVSLRDAADAVEAIDVDNHEYDFYADDGTIIAAFTEGQVVHLAPTDKRRPEELRARLARYLAETDAPEEIQSCADVLEVAQFLIDRDWAALWPRRPRWLARRVNGERPPQIQRA